MRPPLEEFSPDLGSEVSEYHDHWITAFRQLARRHPERTALIAGEHLMSYGELDGRSDQLASMLRSEGIQTGDHIGAGFHRSIDLIVALLGILKSGAAYVPIDPSYPAARIAQMIRSGKITTAVTSSDLESAFPEVRILSLERAMGIELISQTASSNPGGNDPVYAIFTSGSTGQPKAAEVFHKGFSNLLEWYRNELSLGPDDRTLVISSPSFDLTQKNLFTPLLTGGTLVLDDCQTYDITRILGLIRSHGITLINCTPSAFYPLVDTAGDDFAALGTLRFAVLGGEPISIPRLRSWLEHPSCRAEVVNSYGPTECTDICLFHRLHAGNLDEFPFVPLGREIPNVEVSIRDQELALLPDGQTGELCIGGAGVGGGYLFDPERTRERFVNGIYRSGDLAKRLPCGTFEFRGRADDQVKVNGFRIELGEIEIVLNGHDHVIEAVVTATDSKLTAHIRGVAPAATLRAYLSERLPSHMIPAEFVAVEAFPLTPNGKVNRKALVTSHAPTKALEVTLDDASLESDILSIWSEILGQPVNDASANFFDLGGNSIHLAVVHVKLLKVTGKDFPITDLFAHPSARAIAAHLSPRKDDAASNGIQDRARLAKAGFARFQRPIKR